MGKNDGDILFMYCYDCKYWFPVVKEGHRHNGHNVSRNGPE